jgi:hypothetical protein
MRPSLHSISMRRESPHNGLMPSAACVHSFEHSPSTELGGLLNTLSQWETESGEKEPMDAAVFPQWIESAQSVLMSDSTSDGHRGADMLLDGHPPTTKVRR